MSNTPMIETLGLYPDYIRQEGHNSFALHEHYISSSGVRWCFDNKVVPLAVHKNFARWSCSRYSWSHLLNVSINHSAHALSMFKIKHEKKTDTNAKPEERLEVFRKLDIEKLLIERCGFGSEIDSPKKFAAAMLDTQQKMDPVGCSHLVAKLQLAYDYGYSIAMHCAQKGLNQDGKRTTCPTLAELDAYIGNHGIGDPVYTGDMKFFGWNGDMETLNFLAPATKHNYEDAGEAADAPIVPTAAHLIGFEGCKNHPRACAMLTVFDEPMHNNYREMNWHLPADRFRMSPHGADRDRMESPLFNSRDSGVPDMWHGRRKSTELFRKEGLDMSMQAVGGMILANDFYERAAFIGQASRIYDPAKVQGLDQMWLAALTNFATRLINTYGPTHASIVEQFVSGYLVMPAWSHFDLQTEEDEEKANEVIDRNGPFSLTPIFNLEGIRRVTNPGEQREAFIDLWNYGYAPHLSRDQSVEEVRTALAKLGAVYTKSKKDNWMDRVAPLAFSGSWQEFANKGGDLGNMNKSDLGNFTQGMDRFVEGTLADWTESLSRVLQQGHP